MATDFSKSMTKINLLKAFAGESQARNRYTFAASCAKKNKEFVKALETDTFSEVTAEEVINTSVDTKVIAEKDAEIATLKAELDKKAPTKKELKEKDEALAAKDKEINNLKAQLETLNKSKGKDDITGF